MQLAKLKPIEPQELAINPDPNANVPDLLIRWRAGDQQAAEQLFERYANRLIALARSQLSSRLSQRVDAEDIVQSVYQCFFTHARAGSYQVQQGVDLWRLLVTMTLHKVQQQINRHTAQKRAVRREQSFGSEDSLLGLQAEVLARDASPPEALALLEEVELLMRSLSPAHRRIVELRLQGYNRVEIATILRCSQRTVLRLLERIKQYLEQRNARNP